MKYKTQHDRTQCENPATPQLVQPLIDSPLQQLNRRKQTSMLAPDVLQSQICDTFHCLASVDDVHVLTINNSLRPQLTVCFPHLSLRSKNQPLYVKEITVYCDNYR